MSNVLDVIEATDSPGCRDRTRRGRAARRAPARGWCARFAAPGGARTATARVVSLAGSSGPLAWRRTTRDRQGPRWRPRRGGGHGRRAMPCRCTARANCKAPAEPNVSAAPFSVRRRVDASTCPSLPTPPASTMPCGIGVALCSARASGSTWSWPHPEKCGRRTPCRSRWRRRRRLRGPARSRQRRGRGRSPRGRSPGGVAAVPSTLRRSTPWRDSAEICSRRVSASWTSLRSGETTSMSGAIGSTSGRSTRQRQEAEEGGRRRVGAQRPGSERDSGPLAKRGSA